MIAAMSYPVFVLYLPSVLLIARWRQLDRRAIWLGLAGAAAPLLLALAWIQSRALLLFDPDTQAGLFRGGGMLTVDWTTATRAIATTARDAFVRGQSYYFDVAQPDFAGAISLAGFLGVIALAGYAAIKGKEERRIGGVAAILFVLCLVVPAMSSGDPGLRRSTGLAGSVLCDLRDRLAHCGHGGHDAHDAATVRTCALPAGADRQRAETEFAAR